MGTAFKMRDLDPRDGSALYHTEPPFMGCEWVATQAHTGSHGIGVWLWQSTQDGDKLAGLTNVCDTNDDGIAFRTYGYEVVGLPEEGQR